MPPTDPRTPVETAETDGELTLTAELPGLDPQSVRVEIRAADGRK